MAPDNLGNGHPMTKQSTLDSGTAGRAARDYASLEDLDRTLDAISGTRGDTDSYEIIAREIERLRGQEDGLMAIGRIAGELSGDAISETDIIRFAMGLEEKGPQEEASL